MAFDLFQLNDRKALVTGGAVGLGRACATALAMAGADVAIAGRNKDTGTRTCERLRSLGVKAFHVLCDVSDTRQVEAMTAEVIQGFGRIDIAINNSGGTGSGSALELETAEWDKTFNVNLRGLFYCAQAQARQMVRQDPRGGKIINIASMYATVAGGNCAYNSAKAGVVHLTRSLASEWGGHNINVNCISPGWALTPGNPIPSKLRHRLREITPMGSLMRYEDIYGAVVYLASAASDFVTGHDLIVDGGHTVNTWVWPVERSDSPRVGEVEEERGRMEDLGDG